MQAAPHTPSTATRQNQNTRKTKQRFYNVFESIYNYYKDLMRYLSELDDGVFIQLSLEV